VTSGAVTVDVGFEVDDLERALAGEHVIIAPNSPTPGVVVAFIEGVGAPEELMSNDRTVYHGSRASRRRGRRSAERPPNSHRGGHRNTSGTRKTATFASGGQ
jgi:hypothetical protein